MIAVRSLGGDGASCDWWGLELNEGVQFVNERWGLERSEVLGGSGDTRNCQLYLCQAVPRPRGLDVGYS
jgi:hypothetical protein